MFLILYVLHYYLSVKSHFSRMFQIKRKPPIWFYKFVLAKNATFSPILKKIFCIILRRLEPVHLQFIKRFGVLLVSSVGNNNLMFTLGKIRKCQIIMHW